MWQRIQTLYLLLVGLLMTLLLFLPMAAVEGANGVVAKITAVGISMSNGEISVKWEFFIIDALIVAIAFMSIFMYKKRVLQMRFCVYNMLLIVGFLIYFGLSMYLLCREDTYHFLFKGWLALPFVALILLFLAWRAIGADEALVRASNRLR